MHRKYFFHVKAFVIHLDQPADEKVSVPGSGDFALPGEENRKHLQFHRGGFLS